MDILMMILTNPAGLLVAGIGLLTVLVKFATAIVDLVTKLLSPAE